MAAHGRSWPTNRSLNWIWDVNTLDWVVWDGSLSTGSITIGTVLQGSPPWTMDVTRVGGTAMTEGQKAMAASVPVVIASDQSALPVTGAFFQATQPVSIAGTVAVSGPLTDAQLRATPVPVSGTVTAVTGGLTDAQLRASAVPVSAASLPLPTNAATLAGQTQPGVDIGDVTINNAAEASAVNIQDGGNTITVDGTVSTKTDLTPSSPTAASVGVSSAQAVASSATRKGLVLVNTSTARISLGFGATAVLDSGITLYPQGSFTMDEYGFDLGAVNAIASAAASNLAIQEFTT